MGTQYFKTRSHTSTQLTNQDTVNSGLLQTTRRINTVVNVSVQVSSKEVKEPSVNGSSLHVLWMG